MIKSALYIYLDENNEKQAQAIVNGSPYMLEMTDELQELEPGIYEQEDGAEADANG